MWVDSGFFKLTIITAGCSVNHTCLIFSVPCTDERFLHWESFLCMYNCRRSLVLVLSVAAVLLAQGAHAQRSRFRLPFTLPPITGSIPKLISCESVLVKTNPDNYPHCHCEFGPWSPFRFSSYGNSSNCTSKSKYVLESTRSRLSTHCTSRPTTQRRTKDVCKRCYN